MANIREHLNMDISDIGLHFLKWIRQHFDWLFGKWVGHKNAVYVVKLSFQDILNIETSFPRVIEQDLKGGMQEQEKLPIKRKESWLDILGFNKILDILGFNKILERSEQENKERHLSCRVLLDEDVVLRKTLLLPSCSAREMKQLLLWQIELETPFYYQQVYFDFIVGNKISKTESDIRETFIAVVDKQLIDKIIAYIMGRDMSLIQIGFCEEDLENEGHNSHKNYIFWHRSFLDIVRQYKRPIITMLGCLVICFSMFLTSHHIINQHIGRLDNYVSDLRRQADERGVLRHEVFLHDAAIQLIVQRRQNMLHVIEMLDAVARILPKESWLSEIHFSKKHVILSGESRDPTSLIALFEKHKFFTRPKFTSSLTRTNDKQDGSLSFNLRLDIVPILSSVSSHLDSPKN